MNSRAEFIVAAVAEAQATIRALDVKLAALLVSVLAPIPLLPAIAECFAGVYAVWGGILIGSALVLFSVSWALAILCYSLAIGAISSPSKHVLNSNNRSGALYGPGLYRFSPIDAVFNRGTVISKIDSVDHMQSMPTTPDDIEREMSFEHLKLIYIRDIKLLRVRWGFRLTGLTVILGASLFTVARYYIKQCGP